MVGRGCPNKQWYWVKKVEKKKKKTLGDIYLALESRCFSIGLLSKL